MFALVREDIQAVKERDPAATSTLSVVLNYPGLHAVWWHRLNHLLWRKGRHGIARWLSQMVRFYTGIEIHPGATIGRRFFIDHGMGVVIGETTEIGKRVRIYQGVTLGALSLPKKAVETLRTKKRHPTVEDDVIIYAQATILGGETVIGARTTIGGNVWLTESVPPDTKVFLKKPELVYKEK